MNRRPLDLQSNALPLSYTPKLQTWLENSSHETYGGSRMAFLYRLKRAHRLQLALNSYIFMILKSQGTYHGLTGYAQELFSGEFVRVVVLFQYEFSVCVFFSSGRNNIQIIKQ